LIIYAYSILFGGIKLSKRQEVIVGQDEIQKQMEYIHYVKEQTNGKLLKYYIHTFGCQMNENDSERLAGMLTEMGYTETDRADDSDLVIFNTCCVRENAELKVYGHLGALKKLKENKPEMIISICGCMMQQKEVVEHITKTYPYVDLIFGTHNLHRFPELVYNALTSGSKIVDTSESNGVIAEGMPIERKDKIKAWVTIMYGCNNFCSYCIVPYVRGRERSRKAEDIVKEVEGLCKDGVKEITLLGQNVNSYGKDFNNGTSFASLLYMLNEIDGLERIRFMTSHPKDLSDELITAMKECSKVCEHLHLPVQAGSTRVLEMMNRRYTKEKYLELTEKIKKEIPGIALTTDIIVGFPGETEVDFEDTLDVVRKVRFDSAYTFLYSKRTGTPAARSTEQIPEEVKKERFLRLLEIQNEISKEINDKLKGAELEVLVEGLSKNNENNYTGRTRTNKIVNFKGSEDMVGKLVTVRIDKIQTWSLEGTVIR